MRQDNLETVWKRSKIRTYSSYYPCRCIITQQQTSDPTLWFVGGNGTKAKEQCRLSKIIDSLSFFEFTCDFAMVNYIHFFLCFFLCFLFDDCGDFVNKKIYIHTHTQFNKLITCCSGQVNIGEDATKEIYSYVW